MEESVDNRNVLLGQLRGFLYDAPARYLITALKASEPAVREDEDLLKVRMSLFLDLLRIPLELGDSRHLILLTYLTE